MLPPESQTWICTCPSTRLKKVRTRPSLPAAARALRSRLSSTCRTWSGSTSAWSPPGVTSMVTPEASGSEDDQLDGLADQLVEVARPQHRGRRTGEDQEVGHQLAEPVRLAGEDAHQPLSVRVRPRREQLGRAAHRGQRVPDLVRQLGRERAQLGQPVGPAELLLDAAQVGQVLEDDQERRRRLAQGRDREPEDAAARRRGHRHLRARPAGEERPDSGMRSSTLPAAPPGSSPRICCAARFT